MTNITFAIDEKLLHQSKVAAAQMNTSLNAVVRSLLEGFVQSVGNPGDPTGNYKILLDFSMGKTNYRKVMSDLGFKSDEELFLAMCYSGLPFPSLNKEKIIEMKSILERFV